MGLPFLPEFYHKAPDTLIPKYNTVFPFLPYNFDRGE